MQGRRMGVMNATMSFVIGVGRGQRRGELLQQLVVKIIGFMAVRYLPRRDVSSDPEVAANIFCIAEISKSLSPESVMVTSRSIGCGLDILS